MSQLGGRVGYGVANRRHEQRGEVRWLIVELAPRDDALQACSGCGERLRQSMTAPRNGYRRPAGVSKNLPNNAARYAADGGRNVVRALGDHGQAVISVRDNAGARFGDRARDVAAGN